MSPLARIRQAAACSVFALALVVHGGVARAAEVAGPETAVESVTPAVSVAAPTRAGNAGLAASATPPATAALQPVQLTANVPAQIAHSALLAIEGTAKPDVLQLSIRRVSDKSLINNDDVQVAIDGKNEPVTRERGTVYELAINDLRGDGARDVDVTVAHDGIREIVSGKVSVAEASTASLLRDHKQVAWWVLNIVIVLVAAMAFSRRKPAESEED